MPTNIPELLQYGAFGLTVVVVIVFLWQTARFQDFTQKLVEKFMISLDKRTLEHGFMVKQVAQDLAQSSKHNEEEHRAQQLVHQGQIDLLKDISRELNGKEK